MQNVNTTVKGRNYEDSITIEAYEGGVLWITAHEAGEDVDNLLRFTEAEAIQIRDALLTALPLPTLKSEKSDKTPTAEWEVVVPGEIKRLRVPGGWLYRFLVDTYTPLTFVPAV